MPSNNDPLPPILVPIPAALRPRSPIFVSLTSSPTAPRTERFSSVIPELDRVLGPGGWVRGATYLLSGDPGAGKSTLLLGAAARVALTVDPPSTPVIYLTAEEAAFQIQQRAARLGFASAPVRLAETDSLAILDGPAVATYLRRGLLVVDSVQRFYDPTIEAEPGSIRQVRAAARALVAYARSSATTVALICHETKSGRAAGPNSLFHDVDAVLHLAVATPEIRVLTSKKNRYAPTDAVGLFRMTPRGLVGLTAPRPPR